MKSETRHLCLVTHSDPNSGFQQASNDAALEDNPNQLMEKILRKLVATVGTKVGEAFFHSLAEFLSSTLDMKYVLIAELHYSSGVLDEKAKTRVFLDNDKQLEEMEFSIAGTLCREVVSSNRICTYECSVSNLYPEEPLLRERGIESYIGVPLKCSGQKPCGLLILLDTRPLRNKQVIMDIVSMVALRAAVELERQQTEKKMHMLSRAVEQSSESVLITDPAGNIEYANATFLETSGYTFDEVRGMNPRIFRSDKLPQSFYNQMWFELLKNEEWHGDMENITKNGDRYWEHVSIYPIFNDAGDVTNLVKIKEDITEKHERDDKLLFAGTLLENSVQAVFVTDKDHVIQYVNPAFSTITGYSSEDIIGNTPRMLNSGMHDQPFFNSMYKSLQESGQWKGEITNRKKTGQLYVECLSIFKLYNDQGEQLHYAMFSDITVNKRNEELIYQQANFDSLTGLPNKALFMDRLDETLKSAVREGLGVVVLLINFDGFKWVNDTFGHSVGDEILKLLSARISSTLRKSDTVSRLVSDEFTVIVRDLMSVHQAEAVAKSLLEEISLPIDVNGRDVFLTASLGISAFPDDAHNSQNLLKNAANAMHQAKLAGRNKYCFYTPEMNREAQARWKLENELRRAIHQKEFEVYYQPMIDFQSRRVVAAEALIRWRHPERGLVCPGEFIALAEETKLIIPIGLWMVQQVCDQIRSWGEEGFVLPHISVNLSPIQCVDLAAAKQILDVIKESAINPERLVLEITESLMMESNDEVMKMLNAYKAYGLRLSVDDFGTGYSSLGYLKQFPVDLLKIDRSFVAGIQENSDDEVLVKAIVAMAKSLYLKVVAEGVESIEQLEILNMLGCDYAQGYFFSKPITAQQLREFVLENNCFWTDIGDYQI